MVNLVPTLVKVELMVPARPVIAAVAPKAIIAATSAYSIRSWPDSSFRRLDRIFLKFFKVVLLNNYCIDALP